ncbi:MAG: type II toxin-antitoxin system YafQ family toxin [Clostridiales bacterium]|jgi:mRNA interferase YafQ|nr:type II toxin-antitoxin system YafQ family toxin [Clostridiales bacterium]
MKEVRQSGQFKRDLKKLRRRGYNMDLLEDVVEKLRMGIRLPPKNFDHKLTGDWKGYRECHVAPDWLLVYKFENNTVYLVLQRTGTHSDLFRK